MIFQWQMRIIICIRIDGARSTIKLPSPYATLRTIHEICMLQGRRRGSRQKRTSIVFLMSFCCLRAYRESIVWNHQIWGYIPFGWSLTFSFRPSFLSSIGTLYTDVSSRKKVRTCHKTSLSTTFSHHLVHFQLNPLCCYFSLLFLTKWKNSDAGRSCIKTLF